MDAQMGATHELNEGPKYQQAVGLACPGSQIWYYGYRGKGPGGMSHYGLASTDEQEARM